MGCAGDPLLRRRVVSCDPACKTPDRRSAHAIPQALEAEFQRRSREMELAYEARMDEAAVAAAARLGQERATRAAALEQEHRLGQVQQRVLMQRHQMQIGALEVRIAQRQAAIVEAMAAKEESLETEHRAFVKVRMACAGV